MWCGKLNVWGNIVRSWQKVQVVLWGLAGSLMWLRGTCVSNSPTTRQLEWSSGDILGNGALPGQHGLVTIPVIAHKPEITWLAVPEIANSQMDIWQNQDYEGKLVKCRLSLSWETEKQKWSCRGGKERVQGTQKWIIRYTIHVWEHLSSSTAAGASNEPNPVFLTMPPESDLLPPQTEDRAWKCRGLAFASWTDRLSIPA